MSKLRIYGDTSGYVDFNVPAVAGTQTVNVNKLLESDSSGNITFDTNTLAVDATNNRVGIGTTSPLSGFHISDGTNAGSPQNASRKATLMIDAGATASADLQFMVRDGYNSHIFFGDATDPNIGMIWYDHSTNHMNFSANTTQVMTIDDNGRIGIGSTSPAYALDVVGTTGNTAYLRVNRASASQGEVGVWLNDWAMYQKTNSANLHWYRAVTGDLLTLDSNGRVGIGTTAPTQTLDVNGTLKTKEQLLSAISKDISTTALDVFVYDTSRDTDNGQWRHRTENTSWYNETLNTSTRGSRREFPSMALIVATTNEVTIYDGDDPDLPMWMKFPANGIIDWPTGNQTKLAVSAVQGQIAIVGNDGGIIAKFIVDYVDILYSSKNYPIRSSRSIAGRGDTTAYVANNGQAIRTYQISFYNTNDVAMTVLSNAQIDPQTGIAQPTTAVATTAGATVFTDDGNYTSYMKNTSAASVIHCCWMGDNLVLQAPLYYGIYTNPFVNESASYVGNISDATYYFGDQSGVYSSPSPIGDVDDIVEIDNISILSRSTGATNSQAGITIHETDHRDLVNQSNTGMACYITSKYNTGWLNGRIKLATCSDTDSTNINDTVLTTNGTFASDTAWTKGTQWTISGGYANITDSPNRTSDSLLTQSISGLVAGKQYLLKIAYTRSAGDFDIHIGGTRLWAVNNNYGNNSGNVMEFFLEAGSSDTDLKIIANQHCVAQFNSLELYPAVEDRVGNYTTDHNPRKAMQVVGNISKSPVATGAELVSFHGFTNSNYLRQPYNSDLSFNTANGLGIYGWFKADTTNSGSYRTLVYRNSVGSTPTGFQLLFQPDGKFYYFIYGSNTSMSCNDTVATDDNVWHMFYARTTSASSHQLWIDGLLRASNTNNIGNINNTSAELYLGVYAGVSSKTYAWPGHMSNMRFTDRPATEDQIKKMYHDEKHNYQPQAKVTLYGSSDIPTAIAYDKPRKEIHAGTSAGRSVFKGLTRISNTTDAVTQSISASNGFVAEE